MAPLLLLIRHHLLSSLSLSLSSVCAWYFTKEVDWKSMTFSEEESTKKQMNDKPLWANHDPCFKCWPVDHPLQPCTFARCFYRFFGCTKVCACVCVLKYMCCACD